MASFKPQIRKNQLNKDKKANIKIRISHDGKTRYIATDFFIEPDFFDNEKGIIEKKYPNAKGLNFKLKSIIYDYESKIVDVSDNSTIESILLLLRNKSNNTKDIYTRFDEKIKLLTERKKANTAQVYKLTLATLKKYYPYKSLNFKNIDVIFLNKLDAFMIEKEMSVNTRSIHFRNIRTIFNEAIDDNIISIELYPFRRFKIKHEKTAKRSLTVDNLKKLHQYTPEDEKEAYIKDMFFLIFFLIGINLRDLYYLQKTNLNNGRINYQRAKTGKLYDVKLIPAALKIIKQYPGKKYLLSIAENYANEDNFKRAIIKFMSRIAKRIEVADHVTSYYARHSWATVASKLGISKDIIAHALGHGNNTVTDVYIDFDLAAVDKANQLVCKKITG